MTDSVSRAGQKLAGVVSALAGIHGNVRAAKQLLALLGWSLPPGVDDIGLTGIDVTGVAQRLDRLSELRSREDATELDIATAVAAVLDALAESFDHLAQIGASLRATPEYLRATGIVEQFFPRLADLVLIQFVGTAAPAMVPAGVLLGVFELRLLPADAAAFQVPHVRQVVRWDRLSSLFTDPTDMLRNVYGWGTPAFQGNALVGHIARLVEHFADGVRLRPLPRAVEEQLSGQPVPQADDEPAAQALLSLSQGLGGEAHDVGLSLYPLRASTAGGSDAGLGLSPYALNTASTSFRLSNTLMLELSVSAEVQGGLALLLRPGQEPKLFTGLLDGQPGDAAKAEFAIALRHRVRPDEQPGGRPVLFAAPGLRLEAAAVSAGLKLAAATPLDPAISVALREAHLRITPEGADGFLASVLPSDGVQLDADLELAWSRRGGLHVRGGVGLRTRIDVKRQFGPLRVDTVALAVQGSADALLASAALTGSIAIGPVVATVDSVGTSLALRYRRGNLGPVDLGAAFLPPSGIGLSVDAHGVVSGGGFLFHDAAQSMYAGVMQLTLHEFITLKAYGLIATRLPDGTRGYSLLVFITAEDFRAVPLGLGFTLQGIGGMVAVHRTFDHEVLRAGLSNGGLATLLFPRDPVGNAGALVRALAAAFPARRGSYLLGLLVRIGWGTPTLVRFELALILEFGARRRLLVIGRISALLPTPQNDLIRLNLEAIGVLDFDQGTAAIDAVLVDSRLAQRFAISGAMALRARWGSGSGPGFVLAVGGLNPRFTPPAGLPVLARVSIALSSGDNPRLTCAAYFAITANTVQFGARAQLYAAAHGFSVIGDVGFDVLVQLAPLHFIADFHASLQLKRGSSNLFKVSLAGEFEGPRPLRVSGKASFEILWCDFTVRFDKTLVDGQAPPLPQAVDVLGELRRALAEPSAWRTRAPRGQAHGVALRKLSAGQAIVLDPLGRLAVQQQVVPLNTARDIDRFGGAPLAGARRFTVQARLEGSAAEAVQPLRDAFAPAMYFEMSDDDKLAAPSFEEMDSGIEFGAAALGFDAAEVLGAPLVYEEIIVDDLHRPAPPATRVPLALATLQQLAPGGAAARAGVRQAGRARYRDDAGSPVATLHAPRYRVQPLIDSSAVGLDPGGAPSESLSFSESRAQLTFLNRTGVRWQGVPTHELVR